MYSLLFSVIYNFRIQIVADVMLSTAKIYGSICTDH